MAHIFSLNLSHGGVPKMPVQRARLTFQGLAGDHQRHRHVHGGPERALCLFSLEVLLSLQAEGHPVYPVSMGEDLTISGLDWPRIEPDSRLQLGPCLVEISQFTIPCDSIKGSFSDGRFRRVSPKVHPGRTRLYARVLRTGVLAVGDPVRVCALNQ